MDSRLTGLDLKTSLSAIADLVLPRECVVCRGGLIPQERHICLECLADFPETHFASVSHNPMADKFNSLICRADEKYEPYAYATALFHYSADSSYSRITQALKYDRNFAAGRFFARMLGERLASSDLFSDVDHVVPVPLHWRRLWMRGYNQAEIIAREIAPMLDARCVPDALRRVRVTKSQTTLSGEQKAANVAGSFLSSGKLASMMPRHILLVDDVFTSGSTLTACHDALRDELGVTPRISIATMAFVGD